MLKYKMANLGIYRFSLLLSWILLLEWNLISGESKPNIIFIMADDLGWNDVGFHNPKVKTPNIDWLAQEGIELTSHYSQPLCSPSRSALMTGKYPSNNGLSQLVIQDISKNCLPLEHKILPQYMKDLGYITKYAGKWHLGHCHKGCLPTNRGFDEYKAVFEVEQMRYKGIIASQTAYFTWGADSVSLDLPNTVLVVNEESDGQMHRYVNDTPTVANLGRHHAIQERIDVREMIMSHKKDYPLFMIVSPTVPHTPLEVTQEMFDVNDFLSANDSASLLRRRYLGLVAALDDIVGETIQSLKDAELFGNSVIIFTSDNGGYNMLMPLPGHEDIYGNNYPLRNGKTSFLEGGIKVPTIYLDTRLPKHTRNTKRDFLMHITDWLPTLTQLAGARGFIGELDGVSQTYNLRSRYSLSNKYCARKGFLIAITDYTAVEKESLCSDRDAAFRWMDWKLIYGENIGMLSKDFQDEWVKPVESPELPDITGDSCYRTDEEGNTVARCLFNLRDDPYEQKNLYDQHPEMVKKLLGMINRYKVGRIQNTYSSSLPIDDENTKPLAEVRVPRSGYCDPKVDFPIKSVHHSCRVDRSYIVESTDYNNMHNSCPYTISCLV